MQTSFDDFRRLDCAHKRVRIHSLALRGQEYVHARIEVDTRKTLKRVLITDATKHATIASGTATTITRKRSHLRSRYCRASQASTLSLSKALPPVSLTRCLLMTLILVRATRDLLFSDSISEATFVSSAAKVSRAATRSARAACVCSSSSTLFLASSAPATKAGHTTDHCGHRFGSTHRATVGTRRLGLVTRRNLRNLRAACADRTQSRGERAAVRALRIRTRTRPRCSA